MRVMYIYQVHVVVMAPGHEHVVQSTPLGVGPELGVERRVVVVRVLLQVLHALQIQRASRASVFDHHILCLLHTLHIQRGFRSYVP
jgi:hypothetical protein